MNWSGAVYSTDVVRFNGRDQASLVRQFEGSDTSPTFQDTTAIFDGHGRLKTKHIPQQSTNAVTSYNYNADDTMQSMTDARGAMTAYTYGNPQSVERRAIVTAINYSAPAGITLRANVGFQYDAVGNRTQMNDGSGTTVYSYDSLSRLTSEARSFNGLSGSFTLGYEFTLAGELNKITDPTNVQINYGFDRVGRLNNVTGTGSLYSGVSNYASGFAYRAWGAVKGFNYGNATSALVDYNSRLQPSLYSVNGVKQYGTNNVRPEGSEFQFYPDGQLKFASDLRRDLTTTGLHHRAYQYDHQARLKNALSGEEAVDFANGTNSNIQNGAFKHNYGYDAFSNVTSRSGRYWSVPDTGADSYNNQGRNTTWSYEADGRVITTNEPPPNPHPYSPLTFGYDAAGRNSSSGYTISRPNSANPLQIFTTISSKNNTYDGTGRLAKMTETTGWNSNPTSSFTRYYLRSSLTGNVIAEYDQNGTRLISTVYAGSEVIAQQVPVNPGPTAVVWNHVNPVTGDGVSSNAQGWFWDRATVDPTGVNAGDSDPFAPPAGAGQAIDPSQSAIDAMVAQMIPGYSGGGPKCYVNGSLTGCYFATSLLSSDAAEINWRRSDPWLLADMGIFRSPTYRYKDISPKNLHNRPDGTIRVATALQRIFAGWQYHFAGGGQQQNDGYYGGNGGVYQGYGGGGSATGGKGGGYDFQKCAALAKRIANLEKRLGEKITDFILDPKQLPDQPPWPGAPNKLHRLGHGEHVDGVMDNLRNKREEYEQNCRGGGKGGGRGSPSRAPSRIPSPSVPNIPIPLNPRIPAGPRLIPVRPGIPFLILPPLMHCLVDIRTCDGSLDGE